MILEMLFLITFTVGLVLVLRSKCIVIVFLLYRLYCIVKYCIELSRHIVVFFWYIVLYFSVFSAYVANKRLHISLQLLGEKQPDRQRSAAL